MPNLFEALLLNYAPSNPVINITWSVLPQVPDASLFLTPDKSILTIKENTLKKAQTYIITCTIKNTESAKAVTVKTL